MVIWLKFHDHKLLDLTKLHDQVVKIGQHLTNKHGNGQNDFELQIGTEGDDFINAKHTLKITILEHEKIKRNGTANVVRYSLGTFLHLNDRRPFSNGPVS